MAHLHHDYGMPSINDHSTDSFLHEGASIASSPSPIMWQLSGDNYIHAPEELQFEPFQDPSGFPFHGTMHPAPVVEFTDLTAPYNEDRRRRRTQTKDKQAISSMHMRRRAQNRASQRAFRERKEKHAQDLQRQLDELETRHKALQGSYNELGSTNKKLADELDVLRNRISVAQASHDLAENSPSMKTPLGPDGELDKKNVTEVED